MGLAGQEQRTLAPALDAVAHRLHPHGNRREIHRYLQLLGPLVPACRALQDHHRGHLKSVLRTRLSIVEGSATSVFSFHCLHRKLMMSPNRAAGCRIRISAKASSQSSAWTTSFTSPLETRTSNLITATPSPAD